MGGVLGSPAIPTHRRIPAGLVLWVGCLALRRPPPIGEVQLDLSYGWGAWLSGDPPHRRSPAGLVLLALPQPPPIGEVQLDLSYG
eukprot:8398676-Pyramimonas_sp.AAC.1